MRILFYIGTGRSASSGFLVRDAVSTPPNVPDAIGGLVTPISVGWFPCHHLGIPPRDVVREGGLPLGESDIGGGGGLECTVCFH